jgi:hypothetical protein
MAAMPNKVADRGDKLAAPQAADDPLQNYCPDLDEWPRSWSYEPRDIPVGQRMVEYFKPFLRDLLTSDLSPSCRWIAASVGGRSSRLFATTLELTADRCSLIISPKPNNAPSTEPAASSFAS